MSESIRSISTAIQVPLLMQPPNSPLRRVADSRRVRFGQLAPAQKQALDEALECAEVALCGYNLEISAGTGLPAAFRLAGPEQLIIDEKVFAVPALLRLHLRHAIELAIWTQTCPGMTNTAAIALLAAYTAYRFHLLMLPGHRQEIAASIPAWLKGFEQDSDGAANKKIFGYLAEHIAELPAPAHLPMAAASDAKAALPVVLAYAGVANPTEYTLTLQGDERLLIDPATGLNKYGCAPRPRPEAITFSSCTASSVSDFAYREAELLRQRLMATLPMENLATVYEAEVEVIRARLGQLLELDLHDTAIILSASGTDAELYPLVLFRSTPQTRLVNIIVAPDEVGSGTVLAASGRHFSTKTPHGTSVSHGDAVSEMGAESIEVVCIPIRQSQGPNLTPAEINEAVAKAVAEADKRVDRIVLHMVDNTKTGVIAPGVEFVLELQKKYGTKLCVVVDACQFRLEKMNLHRYLGHGFSILITGSKFFTGPPFAGAFLIPSNFQVGAKGDPLPRGFADYFTRHEVPQKLRARAQHLSVAVNLGLLFRWAGALQEMRAFYAVPARQRSQILRSFRDELSASIEANADLQLIKTVPPSRWPDADTALWDALPTIFSFAVRAPGGSPGQVLRINELKKLHVLLNKDCSGMLPVFAKESEHSLASQLCHIGQPVTIARSAERGEIGALRIACGARLVYGITWDDALGAAPVDRFQREITDARTVLAKISLILKYWPQFNAGS